MNPDLRERIEMFNKIVDEAETLSSIARDSELQRAIIRDIADFSGTLKKWKQEAIAEKSEADANRFLGMECVLEALSAECRCGSC